jgi:hypothetical protein
MFASLASAGLMLTILMLRSQKLVYQQEHEKRLKQVRTTKEIRDLRNRDERGRIGNSLAKVLRLAAEENPSPLRIHFEVMRNNGGIYSIIIRYDIGGVDRFPLIAQINVSLGGWAGEGIHVLYGPYGSEAHYGADELTLLWLTRYLARRIRTYNLTPEGCAV